MPADVTSAHGLPLDLTLLKKNARAARQQVREIAEMKLLIEAAPRGAFPHPPPTPRPDGLGAVYRRRNPTATSLYPIVQHHLIAVPELSTACEESLYIKLPAAGCG